MSDIRQPLSNVQLEILKVFSYDLSINELKEFKDLIAKYFAERAVQSADKSWDEKGWNNEEVEKILNTKLRKSKKD